VAAAYSAHKRPHQENSKHFAIHHRQAPRTNADPPPIPLTLPCWAGSAAVVEIAAVLRQQQQVTLPAHQEVAAHHQENLAVRIA